MSDTYKWNLEDHNVVNRAPFIATVVAFNPGAVHLRDNDGVKKRWNPTHPEVEHGRIRDDNGTLRGSYRSLSGWDPQAPKDGVWGYLHFVMKVGTRYESRRVADLTRSGADTGFAIGDIWNLVRQAFGSTPTNGSLCAWWISGAKIRRRTELHPFRVQGRTEPPPPVDHKPISRDLKDYKIDSYNAQDIRHWEVTSTIKYVKVGDPQGELCVEHTKRGKWPTRTGENGNELEGNPWIFARVEGVLRGTTFEWMRPGQECKRMIGIGDGNNLAERLGLHSRWNWTPQDGEEVGIMMSAFARHGWRSVLERSNMVVFKWNEGKHTFEEVKPPPPQPKGVPDLKDVRVMHPGTESVLTWPVVPASLGGVETECTRWDVDGDEVTMAWRRLGEKYWPFHRVFRDEEWEPKYLGNVWTILVHNHGPDQYYGAVPTEQLRWERERNHTAYSIEGHIMDDETPRPRSGDLVGTFCAGPSRHFKDLPEYRYRGRVEWFIWTDNGRLKRYVPPAGKKPATPTSMRATIASWDRVVVEWNDTSDNETGFVMEMRHPSGNWVVIGRPGPGMTKFNVMTDAETKYEFRVKATGSDGDSGFSNVATVTTPKEPVEPPPPPPPRRAWWEIVLEIIQNWQRNRRRQ